MTHIESATRIAVTSDLHYDESGQLTSPRQIQKLLEEIYADEPLDALVIAGDLAHGLGYFRACLAMFSEMAVPVAVIAGNHDVWRDNYHRRSSHDLWHTALPQAVRDAGMIWLEDETLRIGGTAVIGSMAWYDYSAIDTGLRVEAQEIAASKRLMNNDANWIDWQYTDPEFAAMLGEGLQKRLDAAAEDAIVDNIVVVTHVPILECQMLRKPHDPRWGFSNAYFGNLTTGQMVMAYDKVCAIASGHTHIGQQGIARRGSAQDVAYYVIPSDYGSPAYITITS